MAFTSMFIGATGLVAHGRGMGVIGNNLANVSTTGYKRADTLFETLISQQMANGSNPRGDTAVHVSQKGMGVGVAAVKTCFLQGSFEASTTATDLAIGGNGFFGVTDPSDGSMHYTRAGVFRFDREGYLLTPQGYRVMGGAVDRETGEVGSGEEVRLPYRDIEINGETVPAIISDPRATTGITLNVNLDYATGDGIADATDPFFAMAKSWNGLQEQPLSNAEGYSTAIKVYDEEGTARELTVHFDRVGSSSMTSGVGGRSYWEYIVTLPPDQDGSAAAGTSGAGLVGMGVLTFNRFGELIGQTSYGIADGGDPKVLSNWTPAAFNADGVPTLDVTFDSGETQTISLNFGLTTSSASWAGPMASSAAGVGTSAPLLGNMANPDKDAYSTTNYTWGSATLVAQQDGYAEGYLRGLNVDTNGYVVGQFTNGQSENLFQISLYRFNSEYGLRREGGNLFSESKESGSAIEGVAQQDGRGVVYGNTLEASNVDMADQFAHLILTQRGFQSNTKVITTSDSILNTTIQIKR
ncbi:MAG: flagellar hook protein FlgE [Desulfovibrionaceae bacterium]